MRERMTGSMDRSGEIAERAREWVRLLASGEMRGGALAELRQWLAADPAHARAFERERAFWQELEVHRGLFAQPELSPVTARRDRRSGGGWRALPRPVRRGLVGAGMAACLAVLVAAPELNVRLRADHLTGTGEIRSVALADGSAAMLDSGSAIAAEYAQGERRVRLLRGRAWFNVAHGDRRPFRVDAAGGTTEDIGTAFEVSTSNGEGADVAVGQGAVRVIAARGATPLTAGQRAHYVDGAVARLADVRPDRIAAWREGELLIDRQPAAAAIAEIRRYRAAPVILMADLGRAKPVSGVFRIDRPDDALAAIAAAAGLRMTRLPGGILLIR